jgi:hypothetical protein
MLIYIPIILMLLTALVLLILRFARPNFKYPWMLAVSGATLSLVSVFFWQLHFPQTFSLPAWQLSTSFLYIPSWLADGVSWPYALSLAALAAAVIWTSVVRAERDPVSWAGTLILTALGILAVAAENPITLLLAWSAIDIFEFITTLRSTEGEDQIEGVIIAFAVRLAGTGLVLLANLVSISKGTVLDFRSIPTGTGILLLVAAGLRLGVLPLHLPYRKDNVVRRGFGTALRLVSAASSLALLARIPASAMNSKLTPFLLILTAITALYAGWNWLNASDEILGRPFWILGCAAMAVGETLTGNLIGSTAWGVALILCGAVLFLFSAREKSIIWLPLITMIALSTLPFTLAAGAWRLADSSPWLFVIPFVPAQALLIAGYLRHTLHPGETSLESQAKWVKIIYPFGLFFPVMASILLGFWGWSGAGNTGIWWLALIVLLITSGVMYLFLKKNFRNQSINRYGQWTEIFRIKWFYVFLSRLFSIIRRIMDGITASLEGEGGLLWSLLLLALILSLLSTQGH